MPNPINLMKNPIVNIIIAILIGWIFYSLGQKQATPVYAVEKPQVFADIKEDVPELKLLWDDQPIDNFRTTRVAIWNAGDSYIDANRLTSSDPIRIEVPSSVKLLNFKISDKSRDDLGVTPSREKYKDMDVIQITLNKEEALEPNDGFAVKIYFTSKVEPKLVVKGRVKGTSGFEFREWGQEFSSNKLTWATWLVLAFMVLFTIDGFYDSYKKVKAGNKLGVIDHFPRTLGGSLLTFGIVYYAIIPEIFGMAWLG